MSLAIGTIAAEEEFVLRMGKAVNAMMRSITGRQTDAESSMMHVN